MRSLKVFRFLFLIGLSRLFDVVLESAPGAEDDLPAFVERDEAAVDRARPLRREAALLFIVSWR
jgi:hypothetical protein